MYLQTSNVILVAGFISKWRSVLGCLLNYGTNWCNNSHSLEPRRNPRHSKKVRRTCLWCICKYLMWFWLLGAFQSVRWCVLGCLVEFWPHLTRQFALTTRPKSLHKGQTRLSVMNLRIYNVIFVVGCLPKWRLVVLGCLVGFWPHLTRQFALSRATTRPNTLHKGQTRLSVMLLRISNVILIAGCLSKRRLVSLAFHMTRQFALSLATAKNGGQPARTMLAIGYVTFLLAIQSISKHALTAQVYNVTIPTKNAGKRSGACQPIFKPAIHRILSNIHQCS